MTIFAKRWWHWPPKSKKKYGVLRANTLQLRSAILREWNIKTLYAGIKFVNLVSEEIKVVITLFACQHPSLVTFRLTKQKSTLTNQHRPELLHILWKLVAKYEIRTKISMPSTEETHKQNSNLSDFHCQLVHAYSFTSTSGSEPATEHQSHLLIVETGGKQGP